MSSTETQSNPVMQAAVDETTFSQLHKAMGDEVPELVEIFFETASDRLQALRSAVAREDTPTIVLLAHTLKGSSAYLGALPFSKLCKGLEMQGRSGNLKEGTSWLEILEQEYHRVKDELIRRIRPGAKQLF